MQMYIDVLLGLYEKGETYAEILNSPVNADRVASEIVGKYRSKFTAVTVTKDSEGHEVAGGVCYDGTFWALLKDALERIERGDSKPTFSEVILLVTELRGWLQIARKIHELKSALKREIQTAQVALLEESKGELWILLERAVEAAKKRSIAIHHG
jgi:hypothetical protein